MLAVDVKRWPKKSDGDSNSMLRFVFCYLRSSLRLSSRARARSDRGGDGLRREAERVPGLWRKGRRKGGAASKKNAKRLVNFFQASEFFFSLSLSFFFSKSKDIIDAKGKRYRPWRSASRFHH